MKTGCPGFELSLPGTLKASWIRRALSTKLERFEKFTTKFSNWLNWIAGIALVAMLALTVVDIVGAKFFTCPVPGAVEVTGFLSVVLISFAIAYTQVLHGHVRVEFFTMRTSQRVQGIIGAIIWLLSFALFAVLAWQSYKFGRVLQISGEVSPTEEIPFYPFVYGIAFACIPVCLVLVVEFLKSLAKAVKK